MIRKLYRLFIFPYTLFILYLMFFGFGRTMMEDNVVRIRPVFSTINFIVKFWRSENYKMIAVNLIGNIVMFIPFGFIGWLFPKYKSFFPLLFAFLSCIISIEALQYFTRLGVCEVDDVILNSIGAGIGFILMKWCDRRHN